MGPGKNIQLQAERVREFIKEQEPVIISVNYVPGALMVDYVFITKNKRYLEMTGDLLEVKNQNLQFIATSNVEAKNGSFHYTVSKEPLLEHDQRINDNSFIMLLKILKSCRVKKVWCAGFDGYSPNEDNYFKPTMEYAFVKDEAVQLNAHIKEILEDMSDELQVEFITYSHYMDEVDIHFASV